MAIDNQSQTPSLNKIEGEIADADLNAVSGGDKAATSKPPPKTTTKEPFLVVTMENPIITSYHPD
jgi:hypothetical protein